MHEITQQFVDGEIGMIELLKLWSKRIQPDDCTYFEHTIEQLWRAALGGEQWAIKLALDYCIGKPTPAPSQKEPVSATQESWLEELDSAIDRAYPGSDDDIAPPVTCKDKLYDDIVGAFDDD